MKSYRNFSHCSITGLFLLLVTLGISHAQIISDNFDSDTAASAPPSPWLVKTTSGANDSVLVSTLAQSPFVAGTNGVILHDQTSPTSDPSNLPELYQSFTGISNQVVTLSYDFNYTGTINGAWQIGLLTSTSTVVDSFLIGRSGSFQTYNGAGNLVSIITLSANTWYHVSVTIDLGANTSTGSITPYGGSATTWNNYTTNASGTITKLDVFDFNTGAVNGDLYLDNMQLSTVPEPGAKSLTLVGSGLVVGFGLLKARKQTLGQ